MQLGVFSAVDVNKISLIILSFWEIAAADQKTIKMIAL